jgi:hypothetical protein
MLDMLNARPVNSGVMPLTIMKIQTTLAEFICHTRTEVWIFFLFLAVGGFLLCRFKRKLNDALFVILPIALFLGLYFFRTLQDSFIRQMITDVTQKEMAVYA